MCSHCKKSSFFLPVRLLSHRFRKCFLRRLRRAFRNGALQFHGELKSLAEPTRFRAVCHQAAEIDWVVHVKPPFGGPRRVLKYLARYTHRARRKLRSLDAVEFLRRFLLHVLPTGLVRIRQFGFLANRVRKSKLERCRHLLAVRLAGACYDDQRSEVPKHPQRCPICKLGRLLMVEFIAVARMTIPDTS